MAKTPFNWVRKVESILEGSKEIPMWGAPPQFPFEEFSQTLASSLQLEDLNISFQKAKWEKGEKIFSGMGSAPIEVGLELSPLTEPFYLLMPLEDAEALSSWTIYEEDKMHGFLDADLQKGFFRYLCLQGLEAINKLDPFEGLSPRIIEETIKKQEGYCIDLKIQHSRKCLHARLVLPKPFQDAFKKQFALKGFTNKHLKNFGSLELPVSFEMGHQKLSQNQLRALSKGDLLLLSNATYSPASQKGTFTMTCNTKPLFQTKLKEEKIKILDYAVYYEDNSMTDDFSENEDMGQEPFDTTAMHEEGEGYEDTTNPEGGAPQADNAPMISPEEIPLTLAVEVSRLKMSLEEIISLEPGNVLDLGVRPEGGVHLTSGGQRVAKGELIQIGEVLGVKITDIGS